ncbi:UDP-galactopyranose mutase [Methylobacterium sp. WSM2598]|uniref:UDP-galactopyranose mutase n=1 Tax=Methylobacterium sp. WSM2598 TaxID=398261 RepID=UPI0003644580|nr:UDP-galactopyranose mutase [Methylobacterium sp. WSM2598]
MVDWLIVGAGFVGAVAAEHLARVHGQTVLVIDRRDHVAGNPHDARNEDGILHHRYGPHIFHTNAPRIADYLSGFTEWRDYEHRAVALIENRLVPIPFNFTSLDIVFPAGKAARIKQRMIERYGFGANTTILALRSEQDGLLRECADYVYEHVFLGYTSKQWGLRPDEIDASVTNRVPVRVSYDDRYFQDSFQKMPRAGYTRMFERMLASRLIEVSLATEWRDVRDRVRYKNVLFTGAIDEFFDYRLGVLPYRSLEFEVQVYDQPLHQPVAQVNYPNGERFTRITEMKHLTGESGPRTMVAIEYPIPHRPGETVPYYPIPRADNEALHREYVLLNRAKTVHFAGRLADYRYYNMDQAVGRAISLVSKLRG